MKTRVALGVGVAVLAAILLAPGWLPFLGTGLVDDQPGPPAAADVAVVLEGTGEQALAAAETWRQAGLVRDVVLVEAPLKTHALVAYWSDFVAWGLTPAASTPTEHLRVVRSSSTNAAEQARTAVGPLRELNARTLVVPGGGIGSRLVRAQLAAVFEPAGMRVQMTRYGPALREPGSWYQNAEDRRAVLDAWLQTLVPYLSGS